MSEERTLSYPDDRDGEPPSQIGPYRLLQKLGEGGMGEVWEAEQERPVRRRVALKLIKAGMDSKMVLARFETERQALALMSHPSIAKVLDAGTSEQGRPYFVMELVRGRRITHYCDDARLSTEARLRLFLQVCEGVRHAHQKGIIHRDIKPSNILIEEVDQRPVPKIIDFGVAKATQQRLTERTAFTQLGQWIGTPEYMSPEQAEMTGLDVDTRSDVYSLGALLYELLVGTSVHDSETLRSRGFDEMRRQIREVEPVRPSTRLTSLGPGAVEVARRRETEPAGLRKQLRGDLDWIAMKALEKERVRRYPSVGELAADVERYLENEPIRARPPDALYRARKFARRHRVVVAFGSLLLLVLVAFSTVTALQARRLERERDRANAEARTARQVSDFFVGLFELVDPSEARGNSITVREVLDRGADRIDRELRSEPAVRSRLLQTFGNVYVGLGLYDQAIPRLEAVVEAARDKGDDEALARGLLDLAVAYDLGDRLSDAERTVKEGLRLLEAAPEVDLAAAARARNRLGVILTDTGRYDEAAQLLEAVLDERTELLGPDHPDVAVSHAALARVYDHLEQHAEVHSHLERALEIREHALGPDHPDTVGALCNLAYNLNQTADPTTVETFERCLLRQEKLLGPDHPTVARTLNNMAIALFLEDPDASRALFERSLEARIRVLGPSHSDVAESLNNLGYVHFSSGDIDAALERYVAALAIWERTLGPDHEQVAEALTNLGQVHLQRGDLAAAERTLGRAVEIREATLSRTTEMAHSLTLIGEARLAGEKWEEAEAALERAAAILEERWAAGIAVTANLQRALDDLIELYAAWGKPDRAEEARQRRSQVD